MNSSRSTLMAAAIAAALSLTACGDGRNNTTSPRTDATRPAGGPAATDRMTADASKAADKLERAGDKVAATAGDAATTAKVKTRLMAEPGIDSLQIDVDTRNGQVTLTGEVDTPQNKARAKELAGSIDGVTGVVDRLAVKK